MEGVAWECAARPAVRRSLNLSVSAMSLTVFCPECPRLRPEQHARPRVRGRGAGVWLLVQASKPPITAVRANANVQSTGQRGEKERRQSETQLQGIPVQETGQEVCWRWWEAGEKR